MLNNLYASRAVDPSVFQGYLSRVISITWRGANYRVYPIHVDSANLVCVFIVTSSVVSIIPLSEISNVTCL